MEAADVWEMIPEKLRVSLQMQVEEAREKLRAPAGVPLLGNFNLSISIFRSVTGIGVLFMVPFLPVTPLRFSTFSFLSLFVGISLYVPRGVWSISYRRYAGLVVATTE